MNNVHLSPRRFLLAPSFLLFVLCFYHCTPDAPETETVNVRMEAQAKNLNPYMPSTGYDHFIAARIFQYLAGVNPETYTLEPMLIKSIPKIVPVTDGPNKGLLVSDFELFDEAVWDNGSQITAKDFEFTLKIIFHPGLETQAWRGYFEYVHSFEPDPANPKKFRIYFKQYYILAMESVCQAPVYPAYHYDAQNLLGNISLADMMDTSKTAQLLKDPNMQAFATQFKDLKFSNDKTAINGSGPYKMETLGEQLTVLVKKENWWGDKLADKYPQLAAFPKTLNYKIVKADEAIENMLKNEEIDVTTSVNPTKFIQWRNDPTINSKYDFVVKWSPTFNRLQFNNQSPKLADKRVRQAIAYAIDYDYLVKTITEGFGQRTVGPVNPKKSYYAKDVPLYNFDVPKAKALLAAAGWTDSDGDGTADKMVNGKKTDLEISLLSTNSVKVPQMTSASIQQSAQQVGIKINVVSIDISELRPKIIKGDFEMSLSAGVMFPGLVDFYQQWYSGNMAPAGDNRGRFANARADSLIIAIRTTEDEAKRNVLYREMQALLHEEQPEVYLYAPDQRYIVAKKFDYVLTIDRPGYFEQRFKLKK